jgi:hypothetical protein
MRPLRAVLVMYCLVWPASVAVSREEPEIRHYFRPVRIEAGETTSDVICFMCPISVRGKIDGDVLAFGGDIFVQGEITGDAISFGGKVVLSGASKVKGDATAIGGEVHRESGAALSGEADSLPYWHLPGQRSFHPYGLLTFVAVNLAVVMLAAYVLVRRRSAGLAAAIRSHPALAPAVGVVFLLAFVLLVVFADGLGRFKAPVLVLITLTTVIAFCCGYAGVALFAGQISFSGRPRFLTLLAGAGLLTLLQVIPVAGIAVMLLVVFLALGSVVVSGLGRDPDWLVERLRCGHADST